MIAGRNRKTVLFGAFAALALVLGALWLFLFSSPTGPVIRTDGDMALPAIGTLPPLRDAAKDSRVLRDALKALAQRDDAYIFANFRATDAEVAAILFLWAGAGPAAPADDFLRRVYGLAPGEPVTGYFALGEDAWPRLFTRFKARLLAQSKGAQALYDGGLFYNLSEDRVVPQGELSEPFLRDFMGFLRAQAEPGPYIDSLLAFIDSTKGLDRLSAREREMIDGLQKIR